MRPRVDLGWFGGRSAGPHDGETRAPASRAFWLLLLVGLSLALWGLIGVAVWYALR
jgi:hypothetical protein